MDLLKKIRTLIHDPKNAINNKVKDFKEKMYVWLLTEKIYKHIPDMLAIRLKYRRNIGKKLNLSHPVTFTEKLQWLKLFNRNPLYPKLVDKYDARKYISEKIGEEYLVPLYGVYNNPEEIDFEKLPNQFVLKCTHDSGSVVICRDKKNFDIGEAKKKLLFKLHRNHYFYGKEWVYKNLEHRIICEKYLEDDSENQLKDYKIYTFNGIPKLIKVDYDRFTGHKCNIYDLNWEHLNVKIGHPPDFNKIIDRPGKLDEMLFLAQTLAKNIPHVRVDFYYVGDKIYFSELTFFHGSGFTKIEPDYYDEILGSWIDLPEKSIN